MARNRQRLDGAKAFRMFEVLRECGALARLLPELDKLWGVPQRAEYHPEVDTGIHVMMVLDMSAQLAANLPVRYACLCHDLGKGTTPVDILPRHLAHEARSVSLLLKVSARLRVPTECKELAQVVAQEHGNIHRSSELWDSFNASALLRLLERCDAFRKPARFADVLLACECDARGRLGFTESTYPQRPRLLQCLAAAQAVDTNQIATNFIANYADKISTKADFGAKNLVKMDGKKIGEAIHAARVRRWRICCTLLKTAYKT